MSDIISSLGRRTLFSLAVDGEGSVGEIAERIDSDTSSIYDKHMPGDLTELKLVQGEIKERNKYGQDPMVYSLSIRGLVALFNFMGDFWEAKDTDQDSAEIELMENVSETHEFLLPKVLDKWDTFEERNVKYTAIESFKLIMEETVAIKDIRLNKGSDLQIFIPEENHRKSFTVSFFSLPLSGKIRCNKLDTWIDIMTSDEEVLDMFIDFYELQREELSRLADSRKILENKIKERTTPPDLAPYYLPLFSHKILKILENPGEMEKNRDKDKPRRKDIQEKGVNSSEVVRRFLEKGMHLLPEALETLSSEPESSLEKVLSILEEMDDSPPIVTDKIVSQILAND
ncbi:hypothetical protein AKJ56_01185 [candidate division MSBL1 archaeon SCGC-AAA382N08]|uniref:Uncharacterized protein n=1 Tax=candidate division MSBL1 archaeon SCGC-AAA382N08 TaxID=1698285 RepID=A0A133VPV3_9EURY|nr:hypothetical protein AKJ56_01185 [candidate division MSBL1 archaeon SCGC-AAA382N08]